MHRVSCGLECIMFTILTCRCIDAVPCCTLADSYSINLSNIPLCTIPGIARPSMPQLTISIA
jgi:hypothetical protein